MVTNSKKKVGPKPMTVEFGFSLTVSELTHLRDLMSIMLPPDGKVTMSAALAHLESRDDVDDILWDKVCDSCEEAGIIIGDSAPNLIVAPSDIVPITVFRFEPHEQQEEQVAELKPTKRSNAKKKAR